MDSKLVDACADEINTRSKIEDLELMADDGLCEMLNEVNNDEKTAFLIELLECVTFQLKEAQKEEK